MNCHTFIIPIIIARFLGRLIYDIDNNQRTNMRSSSCEEWLQDDGVPAHYLVQVIGLLKSFQIFGLLDHNLL